MAANDRLLKPTDQVYDLVEEVATASPELKRERKIIALEGCGCNRVLKPEDEIYNLCDVFEEGKKESLFCEDAMAEDVRKIVLETAERIARELIPNIAEMVIREEIEKLKNMHDDGAYSQKERLT